jgi:glucose 1-dehydrogenase
MRFLNKVCLITGGASGIGKATSMAFAKEGAFVLVIDLNENNGKQTVSEINAAGGKASFIKTDISQSSEIKRAVQFAIDTWNRIDILVNNAAMMTFKKIVDLEEAEWDKVQAVNIKSVFLFCKYAVPHMQGGAIVNVSSVHAHETTANVIPYSTSKGGMEAFTRGMSREYEAAQFRINCVAPGAVDTPMLWSNPNIKSGVEKVEGAIGKPEDLASAICYLASDEARYINGTTLVVDGGRLDIL